MAATRFRLSLGLACALAACAPGVVKAQSLPAFPGADGAAANVSGGRGGIVYHVTKLNSAIDDPQRNDPGTIRYGLNNGNFPAGAPRTIVFDVGGVFHLGRLPQPASGWDPNGNGWDAQSRLTIGGTNVTLAGQTAPGAGVIFMGGGLKPQGNNNIIRNVTVAAGYGLTGWWKPGDPFRAAPGTPEAGTDASQWFPDNTVYDAMDISGTNLMIDHVSTLFATDETISMNEVANNITVQYSNISQGQNYPQWDAEGGGLTGHALGSLLSAGDAAPAAISFHHNLYAHLKGRVPQVGDGGAGGYYDFRNNVFYNWFGTAGSRGGNTFLNVVNNFYLAGDGGDNPAGGTNPAINTSSGGTGVIGASSSVYRNGNVLDSNKDADANDGVAVSNGGPANPLWAGGVTTYQGVTDPATQAFDRVLNYMGANWWNRDSVIDTPDERIINEARTGTGKVIAWADDPWNNNATEGVEWRALKNTPQTSRPAHWDTEASVGFGVGDGMPSDWELVHGLDPNARDDAGDFDADGYTNLEEYINDIAAWPAPAPIVFSGATNARYAQVTNWDANADLARTHNWQPSRYDVAELRNGTTEVDAVGQHAGTLRVAPHAGNSAALDVTAGWLDVAGAIEVGFGGPGTVNHSGGAVAADSIVLAGGAVGAGFYNLSGTGALRVGTLDKDPNEGGFTFTGGVLAADVVTFDVTNDGGAIAPGDVVGATHIMGDLTMLGGSVHIDIAGATPGMHDRVVVDGQLAAGGFFTVSLLAGYAPAAGATFDVFDFATAGGSFTIQLPPLVGHLAWDTADLLTTGELAVIAANADFNGDNQVDGADLMIWQAGLGLLEQTDRTRGDANGDGVVDSDDLGVWRQQFGATSTPAGTSIPEPAAGALAACALVGLASVRLSRLRRASRRGPQFGPSSGAIVAAVILLSAAPAAAQQLAFPEAEGFGRFASGARTNLAAASIYHVTNLNDNGPGSLRDALSASNRFVVFDVGGIINLNSVVTVASNITIAGQTAPGGIQVFGDRVAFHGANNLISRHWAIRKGSASGRDDAASLVRGHDMIWDHMSITWGVDGTFDINPDSEQVIDNITIQNTIIGQGLDSVNHSTGGLMTIGEGNRFSVIKSLFIDNETRNPKARGENEFINNVVYGYVTVGYIMGDTAATSHANAEGNYFIEGPANGGSPFDDGTASFHIYANDNWVDGDRDGLLDGSLITSYPRANVVATRHAFPTTASMTAQQAVPYVMTNVGPHITRDVVDTRLVQEVASNGTLGGILVRDSDMFPNYGTDPQYVKPRGRLIDVDNDSIPDNWETAHGLNPLNPVDWKGLAGGYTRLEQYLNELGGNGATRTTAGGAWTSAATWGGAVPTFADAAVVSGGLTLDAGQAFARRLTLDGASNISGGTLDIFDTVLVGSSGAGSLTMDGGVVSAGQALIAAPGRTGSLTLNGGTLQTGTIASAGGAASLAWNGGTIRAIGAPKVTVPIGLGSNIATFDTNGYDGEISGAIVGSGGFHKTGAGNLKLSGANSIGQVIGVSAGTLSIGHNNALGAAPQVIIAPGATLDTTPAGGTVTAAANQTFVGGGTIQGNLLAAAGSVIQPNGSFIEHGRTVGIQAEAMTRGSDWAVFNSAAHGAGNGGSYSGADLNGGGVVLVSNESLGAPTTNGALSTTVNLPIALGWKLFVRICEPTLSAVPGDSSTAPGGNNSFWISNNAGSLAATVSNFKEVQTATTSPNGSHWSVVSPVFPALAGVVGSPIVPGIDYSLAPAGPQTFTVYGREMGTILDGFVLSTANLTAAQLDAALAGATSAGTTLLLSVTGNFTQAASSTLLIEIKEGAFENTLAVGGSASLAGYLKVDLFAGVTPLASDQFTILTAASVTGTFAGLPNGARVLTNTGGSLQVTYASGNVTLGNFIAPNPADFDQSGVVDADDLAVWTSAAAAGTAAGDANGDGQTDGGDFLVWQRQLGSSVLSAAAVGAVPEPTALTLLFGTTLGMSAVRTRGRH